MRVAIDARAASHPQPGGFHSYASQLVGALAEVVDETIVCRAYLDRPGEARFGSQPAGIECVVLRDRLGIMGLPLREQILLPLQVQQFAPDVVHYPCSTGAVWGSGATVATIHDAIVIEERPSGAVLSRRSLRARMLWWYNRAVQARLAKRATVVIAGSDHAAMTLVRRFGVVRDKIRVVPHGVAGAFTEAIQSEATSGLVRSLGVASPYVLILGSASARKNVDGALRCFAALPTHVRQRYEFVVVWSDTYLRNGIESLATSLGLQDRMVSLTDVRDDQLVALYVEASLFVYPSTAEGFGLPVLEAMACGTPVVCTSLGAVPEIAGTAAIVCDPRDVKTFGGEVLRVLESKSLQDQLRRSGRLRARAYTWRRTAELTIQVYHEAVSLGCGGQRVRVNVNPSDTGQRLA